MEQEKFIILSKYFIKLIRFGMGFTETPPEKTDDFSWRDVYQLAKNHSLRALAFYAIQKAGIRTDDELYKKWEQAYRFSVHADLQQQIAWEELKTLAGERGIDLLPVKGINLKTLYPQSALRQMGDIDALYKKEKFKDLKKALTEAGYEFEKKSMKMHHQVFTRPPMLHLEMHGTLVDGEVAFAEYYADPWARAKETDEPHIWRFSHEDEYIYVVLHAAKHYFTYGSGLRTFLDLYVFLQSYGKELDFAYIEEEMNTVAELAKKKGAEYDLAAFEKTARSLAYDWFDSDDTKLDQVGLTVLSGGVYGVLERGWKKEYEKKGKKYLFGRLFPSLKKMQQRNPVLKKAPFLLPFFWIGRLFKGLTSDSAHREYRYIQEQKNKAKK